MCRGASEFPATMRPPIPQNELQRLDALRHYRILDTPAEQAFDDIACLASIICRAPVALMTLVDKDRQWFKARVGIDKTEMSREHAFCAHTIMGPDVFIVEDAAADERFAENPYVTSEPHIRFYAGAPLIDGEGHALGSLCVIDREPRVLEPQQALALKALARQVIAQLEFRRVSAQLAGAFADVRTLSGLLPICAHCKGIRNDAGYWETVERYVTAHTEAEFSHGICPACMKLHFPDIEERLAPGEIS